MTSFATLLLLLLLPAVAYAGPLEDAETAAIHGDYTKALSIVRPLAEKGDVEAQYALGAYYSAGAGVTKDDTEALKWFRKSADQGNLDAMIAIGNSYNEGEGVAKDHTEALKWYLNAMRPEIAQRAATLGGSDTLPNDRLKAYKLIRKALYLNFVRYSVDPGPLEFEAARQIVTDYESGLTYEQIIEAAREVPLTWRPTPPPHKQP